MGSQSYCQAAGFSVFGAWPAMYLAIAILEGAGIIGVLRVLQEVFEQIDRKVQCRVTMDSAQIEKISKALADQTRLRIFEAIAGREEMNCGAIVALQGVTPGTVSHHLKILAEAGLIRCCRDGQFIYNNAIRQTLRDYTRALARLASGKKPVRH